MTRQTSAETPDGDLFDRILDAAERVLVLETTQEPALIEQVRQRVRRSGESVYLWSAKDGLHSLREGGVAVPGCLHAIDTLRHVHKAKGFGVYLMTGLAPPLDPKLVTLLGRIQRAQLDASRHVVLLSDGPELAEALGPLAGSLRQEAPRPARHLRLRDGRWVVSDG